MSINCSRQINGRVCKLTNHARSFSQSLQHDFRITEDSKQSNRSDTAASPTTNHLRLKAHQRDLVIDILGASTTKREAKSYLNRLQSESDSNRGTKASARPGVSITASTSVNLGRLFNNEFIESKVPNATLTQPLHVAIVEIRSIQQLSDQVLHGVTRTLGQLSELGMQCVVVVDTHDPRQDTNSTDAGAKDRNGHHTESKPFLLAQADRLVDSVEEHLSQRARRLESLFEVSMTDESTEPARKISLENTNFQHFKRCLALGIIPIIVPLAQTKVLQLVPLSSDDAVMTLSRTLSGTTHGASDSTNWSLDRLIILDSNGGIPVDDTASKAHVFINLEQEYDGVKEQLNNKTPAIDTSIKKQDSPLSALSLSHKRNLTLARNVLRWLPPTSSALITSAEAVARYEHSSMSPTTTSVATRPQKNLLIHNILTDKPIRSSSLPPARLTDGLKGGKTSNVSMSATFLKRGMPITIVPDPKVLQWVAPSLGTQLLMLNDPRLDIGRLVHLIEDSFGRALDQKHYFSRIAPNLAGVIIAGAYEGGAILTWEKPASAPEGDPDRLVPYLDKFAVLQRSQGAGGVADVVFSAMVRDCFPRGVCWRSRSNNPVNKWYFERARGSCKLHPKADQDQNAQSWTMFWTTPNIEGQRLKDYEEVCRSIGSSWADGKPKLD